jgi:lipopolysaccharide export system protein LptC
MIELQDINAIVEMDQNESMKVTAATGVFDTKNDKLALDRDIVVTSGGYEGELDEAVIDTKSGNVVSEKPVKVRMLNGTVNANRLEVLQSGNLLRFEKGVVVNMRMNEDSTPAAKPAETPQ